MKETMLLKDAEKRYKDAAKCLGQDEKPVKERLKSACRHFLGLHRVDIPHESLWTEHEGIKHVVTKVKKGRAGPDVAKTIKAMSEQEAREAAERILRMADRIEETRLAQARRVVNVG